MSSTLAAGCGLVSERQNRVGSRVTIRAEPGLRQQVAWESSRLRQVTPTSGLVQPTTNDQMQFANL